jgi:predicted nucleic acid-binding protein
MGGLSEKLTSASIVGLDTSIFICHLEANPIYIPLTKTIFESMEKGKFKGVTSAITLMELTVLPWRMGYENVAREYEAVLVNFPNLSIVEVDRDVARLGAKLRADYNFTPADALQVAGSLQAGATAFLTNDKKLSGLQKVIEILILDDFVAVE